MDLLFLGADAVTPAAGDDTACALLNGTVLIDTGWSAPLALQRHGLTASSVTWLLLTHCHHDHYLGLPQLLFWRWMKRGEGLPLLHLAGPAEELARVVALSCDFLQTAAFGHEPEIALHPLAPGDALEAAGLRVSCARTRHPVASLCYRLDDPVSGASLAYTGDTSYCPPLVDHVRGVDLLVHEAVYGEQSCVGMDNDHGHSGAPDAARIAAEAEVGRLALTHAPLAAREPGVKAARAIFERTWWPVAGERVVVG